MRLLSFILLLQVALTSTIATAAPPDDVEAALSALGSWNMASARRAVARVAKRAPEAPVTHLLEGQLAFFEGRYPEAVKRLTQAELGLSGDQGIAAHLAAMARAVENETRDYQSHTTSGGNFIIRWRPGLDDVMIPWMDEVLEAAWENLTARFGQIPEVPVRVEVYPKAEVLAAVTPLSEDEIRQSGTIALCKYNRLMITSPRDLIYGYGWADTLAHEFLHLLITQRSQNTVPIWLHEGLAKYYEVLWRPEATPTLDRSAEAHLARALKKDSLISFEAMSPSMAKLPDQEATTTAFAEVHTVIGFLEGRHGKELPQTLTRLMAEGKSDREAVSTLARMPWPRFEAAWRAHIKRLGLKENKEHFDTRLLFKGHDTEADELSLLKGDNARRFVWLGDRLSLESRPLAASKEYKKAADAVGEAIPFIQAKLGRALLALDRVDRAIIELTKALNVDSNHMLIRLYLGEAMLRQGEAASARTHLEEAVLINPFDPQLHDHLTKVYEALGLDERAARARAAHAKVMAQRPPSAP